MAAMTIRMGETSAFQMSNAAVMGMMAVFHVSFAALDIFQRGATIKATTAGRMPLNIRSTTGLSAKEVKQSAMVRMMRKEGSELPKAHIMLPLTPLSL